jgi:hypothetical protein
MDIAWPNQFMIMVFVRTFYAEAIAKGWGIMMQKPD